VCEDEEWDESFWKQISPGSTPDYADTTTLKTPLQLSNLARWPETFSALSRPPRKPIHGITTSIHHALITLIPEFLHLTYRSISLWGSTDPQQLDFDLLQLPLIHPFHPARWPHHPTPTLTPRPLQFPHHTPQMRNSHSLRSDVNRTFPLQRQE